MIKVAWFVIILYITIRLAGIKSDLLKRDKEEERTISQIVAEILVVGFLVLCAIIVTLDILRWIYPILH